MIVDNHEEEPNIRGLRLPSWLQELDNSRGVCGHGEEWQPCARLGFGYDNDRSRPRRKKQ